MRRSRSQGPVSLTNVPNSKTKSRGFRPRRSLSPGAPADRRRPGLDRPGRHRTVQRELALLRRRQAVKRPENDLSTGVEVSGRSSSTRPATRTKPARRTTAAVGGPASSSWPSPVLGE